MPRPPLLVEVNGESICLREVSRRTGIHYSTLQHRWRAGDRDYASLSRPLDPRTDPKRRKAMAALAPAPKAEPAMALANLKGFTAPRQTEYRHPRGVRLDYAACMVKLR